MKQDAIAAKDGNVYIPYEKRDGETAVVYFTRDLSAAGLSRIFDRIAGALSGKIAVKVHTGEAEGPNILPRPWVKGLLSEKLKGATVVETNTYYRGSRYTTEEHKKTLKVNGWDFCPVDILDEDGISVFPIRGGKWLDGIHVGSHLLNYDSLLALTHFKGHTMGGFGGCNKNIGIGCADGRLGKAEIHTTPGSPDMWDIHEEEFMERMTESTKGTVDHFGGKVAYVNVLRNISVSCDCEGKNAEPVVTPDVGILASLDLLAIDACGVDMLYQLPGNGGRAMIERMESRHGLRQLSYMKELGMGHDRYTLIDIDRGDAVISAKDATADIAPAWHPDVYNTFLGRNKKRDE